MSVFQLKIANLPWLESQIDLLNMLQKWEGSPAVLVVYSVTECQKLDNLFRNLFFTVLKQEIRLQIPAGNFLLLPQREEAGKDDLRNEIQSFKMWV